MGCLRLFALYLLLIARRSVKKCSVGSGRDSDLFYYSTVFPSKRREGDSERESDGERGSGRGTGAW